MNSIGYIRLVILPCLLSALCLHVARSQAQPDPDETSISLAGDGAEEWDAEKYNKEADETSNLVFHTYNKRVRPPDHHVVIDLAVTLTHVRHLDVDKQELQTVLDIEMNWVDSRLNWRPEMVKEIHESTKRVWCPDLVYMNGVSPIQQLYPNIVRIIHNGSVTWIRKEIVTTRCETEPSSKDQACTITIGFATNSPDDRHHDKFFFSEDSSASMTSDEDLFSHQWHLKSFELNKENENETESSTIDLDLAFEKSKAANSMKDDDASPASTRHTTRDYEVVKNGGGSTSGQRSNNNKCGCSENCRCHVNGGGKGAVYIRNIPILICSFVLGLYMVRIQKGDIFGHDR